MSDYLRCRVCVRGRSRRDTILDLSLVIKPWGSTKAFQSIEEALQVSGGSCVPLSSCRRALALLRLLQEYVRSEVMDGDNCVLCETCQKKTAHDKGLALSEPPYLLQLQLKRFGEGGYRFPGRAPFTTAAPLQCSIPTRWRVRSSTTA